MFFRRLARPRAVLNLPNLRQDRIECRGETLMHQHRIVTLNEMRIVAIASEKLRQFLAADARQNRRIGDLEAVELKYGKKRPPSRAGFRNLLECQLAANAPVSASAVTDDAGHDQLRIVEGRTVSVEQRIAQFTALVDRTWSFRRDVARNSVGPGELAEEPSQSVPIALNRRIALSVRSFQIGLRHQTRAAMTRADDVHHAQVVLFD